MDKVSDFFSELKERISNPFISSYIIAWCVWNYEIIVGLVFYKQDDLKRDSYTSYLDLISKNSGTWHFLWQPLLSAIAFTLLFPVLKNAILIYGGKINVWGEKRVLEDSRSGVVATDLYLKETRKYEEAMLSISSYITAKSSLEADLAELKVNKMELTDQIAKTKLEGEGQLSHLKNIHDQTLTELSTFRYYNSNAFLQGTWNYSLLLSQTNTAASPPILLTLKVQNNTVTLIDDNSARRQLKFESSLSDTKNCVLNLRGRNTNDLFTWKFIIVNEDLLIGSNEIHNEFRLEKQI